MRQLFSPCLVSFVFRIRIYFGYALIFTLLLIPANLFSLEFIPRENEKDEPKK